MLFEFQFMSTSFTCFKTLLPYTNHLPVDKIVSTEAEKMFSKTRIRTSIAQQIHNVHMYFVWSMFCWNMFDAVELTARRAHKSNSQWIEYLTLSWIRRGRACCSSSMLFLKDHSEKDRSNNKTKDSRKLIEREWAKWNLRSIEIQN